MFNTRVIGEQAIQTPYLLHPRIESLCVIGSGGGRELMLAKSKGVHRIVGVEINAATTELLRDHYKEKRQRYGIGGDNFYDQELRRLFSDSPEHAKHKSAASFLRRIRREVRQVVAQWTGQYQYTIDQVLSEMIERCRELQLRLSRPEENAKRDALVMLTVQTMNYLHGGRHKVAL